jgi:hypothetical protein
LDFCSFPFLFVGKREELDWPKTEIGIPGSFSFLRNLISNSQRRFDQLFQSSESMLLDFHGQGPTLEKVYLTQKLI